jgi:hypothetical protein
LLIVDGDGRLTGIVTSYDSTEYFRRRSEDLMRVRGVELMVKDLVRAAFIDASGVLDEAALNTAVATVTSPTVELKGRFMQALRCFLKAEGRPDGQLDPERVDRSFAILAPPGKPRSFDRLTMQEYINLLLHPSLQAYCEQVLRLEPKRIRSLLEGVRDTRNKLAHFRDEDVTTAQREQLQFCEDWLNHVIEWTKHHRAAPLMPPPA